MRRNVEIKARTRDFAAQTELARALADGPAEVLDQIDTFYRAPQGRLKLREIAGRGAELIFYQRPDQAGPKTSQYRLVPLEPARAADLKALLAASCGELGRIVKRRTLLLVGQTRIHLDQVEQLGSFIELEVVLREGQSTAEGRQIADDLLPRLGILPEDLLAGAYLDLAADLAGDPSPRAAANTAIA